MKKYKRIMMILFAVICIVSTPFGSDCKVVNAAEYNATDELNLEDNDGTIDDDILINETSDQSKQITIEDEITAKAAAPQNSIVFATQLSIIGLGVIMAGLGTYIFLFKKENKTISE